MTVFNIDKTIKVIIHRNLKFLAVKEEKWKLSIIVNKKVMYNIRYKFSTLKKLKKHIISRYRRFA